MRLSRLIVLSAFVGAIAGVLALGIGLGGRALASPYVAVLAGLRGGEIETALESFLARTVEGFEAYRSQVERDRPWRMVQDIVLTRPLRHAMDLAFDVPARGLVTAEGGQAENLARDARFLGSLLAATKAQVASWGGQLTFVFLSGRHGNPATVRERDAVFSEAGEPNIPVVDVTAALAARLARDDQWALGAAGGHYSSQAYGLAGRHILCALGARLAEGSATGQNTPCPR